MRDSDLTECLVENVNCFAEQFSQTVMYGVPFYSEVKWKVWGDICQTVSQYICVISTMFEFSTVALFLQHLFTYEYSQQQMCMSLHVSNDDKDDLLIFSSHPYHLMIKHRHILKTSY